MVACSNCEAIQRMCDQRILAEQQRCLDLIETRETILVEAFVKHLRRTDRMVPNQRSFIFETDAQRVGRKKASMTRRATRALGVALGLLVFALPHVAWALGPTVTAGCVARWTAVTTSGGVPLQPADGTVSYKVYLNQTAATGGPVTPPTGSTVILAAGPSVPICTGLTPGQQYTFWPAAVVTPPPPPAGQLPGTPAEGPPGVGVPFVMGTAAPATKVPDAPINPSITP